MINNTCQGLVSQAKSTNDTLKLISEQVMRADESDNESADGENNEAKNFRKTFQNLVGKRGKSADTFEDKLLILKKLILKKKQEEIENKQLVLEADELFSGTGVDRDVEKAISIYQEMNKKNNLKSKLKLALI